MFENKILKIFVPKRKKPKKAGKNCTGRGLIISNLLQLIKSRIMR